MKILIVSRMEDVKQSHKKTKRKFSKDKEFGFALWPESSLRLIMDGTYNNPEDFD